MSLTKSLLIISVVCWCLAAVGNVIHSSFPHNSLRTAAVSRSGITSPQFIVYSPNSGGHNYYDETDLYDVDDLRTDSQEIPSAEIIESNDSKSFEKELIIIRECSLTFSESDKFFLSKYFPRV